VGNRLRAFPNPGNASLTDSGKNWVFGSKIGFFLSGNHFSRDNFMRDFQDSRMSAIDSSHKITHKRSFLEK
jgi:hypothetical protein